MTKLYVKEFSIVSDFINAKHFVEWRWQASGGQSGDWHRVQTERRPTHDKNFLSAERAMDYVRKEVEAGRGVWAGHREQEEQEEQVNWTEPEKKRLEFLKWLVSRGVLSEEVPV